MDAMSTFFASIDQSTTSTKFMLYNKNGDLLISTMREHTQITLQSGWLEHDPTEIVSNLRIVVKDGMEEFKNKCGESSVLQCVGITNQRETVVAWNKHTGTPYHNAIVWCDGRTKDIAKRYLDSKKGNINAYKSINGLPISVYFTAFKIKWLLENVPEITKDIDNVCFGTMDSWITYSLTGKYLTDVTNACRTFLMDIKKLEWSQELLDDFGIKKENLPTIVPSCYDFGIINDGALKGVKVTACLGDQQAATLGHGLLQPGGVKNTYGTGCFFIVNTGKEMLDVPGLLTTVCYKLGEDSPTVYALEGAIETGATTVNWLKNKLELFKEFSELDKMLRDTTSNGGVYFVPAFSGLFSPFWDDSAAGTILGLTHFSSKAHIVRACLEAVCYRVRDVIECIQKNSEIKIDTIKVDGGLIANDFMTSFQATLLQKKIVKSLQKDSTCFGAAIAAAYHCRIYENLDQLQHTYARNIEVAFDSEQKQAYDQYYQRWTKAIERARSWLD